MKITSRQLRRIIREACAAGHDAHDTMPCPIEAATKLKEAGATESEVLDWVQRLISSFSDRVSNIPEQDVEVIYAIDGQGL